VGQKKVAASGRLPYNASMTQRIPISGKATAQATQAYHARFDNQTPNLLNGWRVSAAGFGGYRVAAGIEPHAAALRYALRSGVNLIDTSANYADGGSEQLVGQVLGELIQAGELAREAVVVVSKAGYLQGQNYAASQERRAAGTPWPDLVQISEGLEHCIHPDFLADQITRSLARLNLQTLDVLLLHNPEYYLNWAAWEGVRLAEARAEYARRLSLACTHLEHEVATGRIQCYGVSSNTFVNPADDPAFTSLARCWAAAQAALGEQGHFHVIQLPFNLLEPGAVLERNNPSPTAESEAQVAVLTLAQALGLGVLVNRPLNAIRDNTLVRLAGVARPEHVPSGAEVSTAVDTSVQLETALRASVLPALALDGETEQQLLEFLGVGLMLHGRWPALGSYQNWRDIMAQFLVPRAKTALQFILNRPNLPPEAAQWAQAYQEAVNATLAAVSAFYQAQGAAEAQVLRSTAVLAEPDWWTPTLSQTAIRAVRATAGVTSVLVGMRQEPYVADVLAELQRPSPQTARAAAWERLQQELAHNAAVTA
jgi:aryl-alcohol dehydrogenase-like predicted oxidoreductase